MKIKKLLHVLTLSLTSYITQAAPEASGNNSGGAEVSLAPATLMRQSVSTGQYSINLFATRDMPLRASAEWAANANAVVMEIRTNGFLAGELGNALHTSYITHDRNQPNAKALWNPARVRGENGSKLNLVMIRYTQHSSDPSDSLKNSYSLVGGNFVYSPQAMGIIYGQNGAADQEITSGAGTQMVDEIIFSGLQSTYYPYTTQAELDSIDTYVRNQNLALTTTIEIVGSGGVVLASASRTLSLAPDTSSPTLSIAKVEGGVEITLHGSFNGNAYIDYRDPGKDWAKADYIPSGKTIKRPNPGTVRIFRARLP